jgi:hypothetical protein
MVEQSYNILAFYRRYARIIETIEAVCVYLCEANINELAAQSLHTPMCVRYRREVLAAYESSHAIGIAG